MSIVDSGEDNFLNCRLNKILVNYSDLIHPGGGGGLHIEIVIHAIYKQLSNRNNRNKRY